MTAKSIAELKREALQPAYRITRLCPGSWAIVNRLTGHDYTITECSTFDECMELWLYCQALAPIDALVSRADKAGSRLDATLASIKANPVGEVSDVA